MQMNHTIKILSSNHVRKLELSKPAFLMPRFFVENHFVEKWISLHQLAMLTKNACSQMSLRELFSQSLKNSRTNDEVADAIQGPLELEAILEWEFDRQYVYIGGAMAESAEEKVASAALAAALREGSTGE